jgi:hypothetical protein
MADIVSEIQCTNAQDKFLIMLLERVEKLEDIVRQSNEHMTSNYFSVKLTGSIHEFSNQHVDLTRVIDEIVKTIHTEVACLRIYVLYATKETRFRFDCPDYTKCEIVIHTKQTLMLDSVASLLSKKIRCYAMINSWTMKREWDYDLERYTLLYSDESQASSLASRV